jgi:hypothetical protein
MELKPVSPRSNPESLLFILIGRGQVNSFRGQIKCLPVPVENGKGGLYP